mgnify:CR=1 FL=1
MLNDLEKPFFDQRGAGRGQQLTANSKMELRPGLAADRLVGSVLDPITIGIDDFVPKVFYDSAVFKVGDPAVHYPDSEATPNIDAITSKGFEVLGLRRIWAECDTRNEGSYGIMEKLRMRREAHLRQDKRARDGWRDSYLYAILAQEWAVG